MPLVQDRATATGKTFCQHSRRRHRDAAILWICGYIASSQDTLDPCQCRGSIVHEFPGLALVLSDSPDGANSASTIVYKVAVHYAPYAGQAPPSGPASARPVRDAGQQQRSTTRVDPVRVLSETAGAPISSSSYLFSKNNKTESLLSNKHIRKAAREAHDSLTGRLCN